MSPVGVRERNIDTGHFGVCVRLYGYIAFDGQSLWIMSENKLVPGLLPCDRMTLLYNIGKEFSQKPR